MITSLLVSLEYQRHRLPKLTTNKLNIDTADTTKSNSSTSSIQSSSAAITTSQKHSYLLYLLTALYILINIVIALLVNIGYVLSVNHDFNSLDATLISISISLFKILFSHVMIMGPGRIFIETWLQIEFHDVTLIAVSIINNSLVPYLAEMFVSVDCFYYAIINPPPSIQSYYYDFSCTPFEYCSNNDCFHRVICPFKIDIATSPPAIISFIPPFHYSYQCNASLLTAFCYVFVYRYVFTGLIAPIGLLILKYLQCHCYTTLIDGKTVSSSRVLSVLV
jgi:hypothetical protein